jgi:hypothetical protein
LFAFADDFKFYSYANFISHNSSPFPNFRTTFCFAGEIAYFIMIHHKPDAFKEMFQKIYTRDQFYLIHIDRKAKAEFTEEIQLYLIHFPNVYILESMNIVSGGFSMIQAELNAMEYLLNVSNDWDYFINLSGEDSPLSHKILYVNFLQLIMEEIIFFIMIRSFTDQILFKEYKIILQS